MFILILKVFSYGIPFSLIFAIPISVLAAVFLQFSRLSSDREIIAMKGQYPHQELQEIADQDLNIDIHPLSIPGVAAERHIVCISGFHRSNG